MSAIARYFNHAGHNVSVYDKTPSPLTAQLESEGIAIHYEDRPDLIPKDVTVQVLTMAREDVIKKTFDAAKGARSAIVHLYNSTSALQREVVFGFDKEKCKQLAVNGGDLVQAGFRGKQIAETLDILLEEVIEKRLPNSRHELIKYSEVMKKW